MDDEELGAGAVHIVAVSGHGDGTAGVGEGVFHAVVGEFALDGLIGAAGAVAVGVAALHHEALHNAVEGQAVIEALVGQLEEVFHGNGSRVGVQLHGNGAVVLDLDLHMVLAGDGRLTGGRFCRFRRRLGRLRGSFRVVAAEGENQHQGCHRHQRDGSQRQIQGLFALGLRQLGDLLLVTMAAQAAFAHGPTAFFTFHFSYSFTCYSFSLPVMVPPPTSRSPS